MLGERTSRASRASRRVAAERPRYLPSSPGGRNSSNSRNRRVRGLRRPSCGDRARRRARPEIGDDPRYDEPAEVVLYCPGVLGAGVR